MEERIVGASKRRIQKAVKPIAIGRAKQRRFLEHLAATCNVRAAARAAAVSTNTLYAIRQRDAAFAAAWKMAIDAGYDRLEEELLAKALGDVEPVEFDPDAVETVLVDARTEPARAELTQTGSAQTGSARTGSAASRAAGYRRPGSGLDDKVALVDVQLALALLNRRKAVERTGHTGSRVPRASAEEVEKAINAKLDRLATKIERTR